MAKKRTYTDKHRQEAAIQYAIQGSLRAVGRTMGISESTVRSFKESAIWDETLASVRAQKVDEHVARYTGLIDELLTQAQQDIPNMKGKDCIISAAVLQDKSRTLQSLPSSITTKVDMESLANTFRELSKRMETESARVISVQTE